MFFGVVMNPAGWAMVLTAALLSLILPFAVIGSIASYFPEPLSTIIEFGLALVGFPLLLCYLHSRKVFGRGLGSVFFFVYKWFFVIMGVVMMVGSFYASEGFDPNNFLPGVLIVAVGGVMVWWSRKIDRDFRDAVQAGTDAQAEAEREEQIQLQAEAILRAEQMKQTDSGQG